MHRLWLLTRTAFILALIVLTITVSEASLARYLTGAAFGDTSAGGEDGKTRFQPEELPTVGTYTNLKALLEQARRKNYDYGVGRMVMQSEKVADTAQALATAQTAAPFGEYSSTNVQVAGVDEADIVKTDGRYIYQVNGRRVVVARAYPATAMQVVNIIAFTEGQFTPLELYVDEKYLVVIGSAYRQIPWPDAEPPTRSGAGATGSGVPSVVDKAIAVPPLPPEEVRPHIYPPLGSLKIPGYSDYLHPYDENHIIGIGKDTIEVPVKDVRGTEVEGRTIAFYQGIKMALFDVSDVRNPVEKFKTIIGDRGTESELLHNHKALLFDREKGLLAFPVTVMEVKDKTRVAGPGGLPEYGEFTFQGAYVYNIDSKRGFTFKGRITHLDDQDYRKAGQHWYADPKNIKRILYIDNTLYTISGAMIKAHDLTTLQQQNSLAIPAE